MALFKKNQKTQKNQSAEDGAQNSQQTEQSTANSHKSWSYSIIKRPLITEKTYNLAQSNVYAFEVASDANKKQVKKAVEALFEVPISQVRIMNVQPQSVSFQQQQGKTRAIKKALVSVKEGYSISI